MESTDSSSAGGSQQLPQLPPGFRFHPTDEELVVHYLKRKAASIPLPVTIIAEVDLYKFDPWQLPEKANFGEQEWYFFSPRDRKYPNGARPNRAATSGYWKATGTDKPILSSSGITTASNNQKNTKVKVGVKKALVFYGGKPPKGIKTNWIMHEYRLIADNANANTSTTARPPPQATYNTHGSTRGSKKPSLRLDDWVLCRIYKKNNSNNGNSNGTLRTSPMEHDDSVDNMLSVSVAAAAAAAASTLPLTNPPEVAAAICRVQQPINPEVTAPQRLQQQQQQQPLFHRQHQHAANYSSALLHNDDNFFPGFLTSGSNHDHHEQQQEYGVLCIHSTSGTDAAASSSSPSNITNMICRSSKPAEQLCLVDAPAFQAIAKRPLVNISTATISSSPPTNYWHQCDPAAAAAAAGISNVIINPAAMPPSKRMLIQAQAYVVDGGSSSNNSTTNNQLINNGNGIHITNVNCSCNSSCTNGSSTNNNPDVDDLCGGGPGEHTLGTTLLPHQIPRSSTSTANYHHRGSVPMGSVLQGDGAADTVLGSLVPYQPMSSIIN